MCVCVCVCVCFIINVCFCVCAIRACAVAALKDVSDYFNRDLGQVVVSKDVVVLTGDVFCSRSGSLGFSARLFKPLLLNTQQALIGPLTHAWASTANNNRAAAGVNYANVWHADVVWCHRTEGGTTDEAFRSSVFCGRRELLLILTFFNFQDLLHKNQFDTLKETRKWNRFWYCVSANDLPP